MYVAASSCLLKKIVWVHINSKWSAVVLASIISQSKVLIGGIESPVAFEVRVQLVFSKLVTNGLLKNCLDFARLTVALLNVSFPISVIDTLCRRYLTLLFIALSNVLRFISSVLYTT
jgi:hypothetical protein